MLLRSPVLDRKKKKCLHLGHSNPQYTYHLNTDSGDRQMLNAVTSVNTEDEENFDRCLQYAMSNFKYHRFLDVNSHKMKRDMEGLRVKFLIHSLEATASAFQTLTEKFLAASDVGDGTSVHTDAHYSVLSLLLLLSNSPTRDRDRDRDRVMEMEAEQPPGEEKDDSFDWASYLLEGDYNSHRGSITNTLDWSADEDSELDEEEDNEEGDAEMSRDLTKKTSFTTASLVMISMETTVVTDRDSGVVNTPESMLDEKMAEVARRIAPQYWTGQTRCRVTDMSVSGCDDVSRLTRLWEKYLVDSSATYVTHDKAQLTEHQILREILWMLLGVSQSFVYTWQTDHFVVNEDIQMSHLTDQTLFNILDDLSRYGNIVWKLNQFVDVVALETSCGTSSSSSQHRLNDNSTSGDAGGICQTYQAFGIAISHVLQQFKWELVAMETEICAQVETATLSRALNKLSPHFVRLDFLDIVFRNGIEACCQATSSNAHKASFLLAQIYATLQRCDALGGADTTQVSFLFPIWMVSCKPYLDIIDQWVTTGQLNDPCQEFVIYRDPDVGAETEAYWEAALEVRHQSGWLLSASHDQQGDDSDGASGVPSFLLPIMYTVVGAGKASELLQHVGGLVEHNDSETTPTLYEVFIKSLQSHLGTQHTVRSETTTQAGGATNVSVGTVDPVFVDNIRQQLQVTGVKDSLLAGNFSDLLTAAGTKDLASSTADEQQLNSKLSQLDWSRLSPVKLLLQTCLYPHISRCYTMTSDRLLQTLKEKFGLMDYFTTVRSLYLMEAGDTMYDFYTPLFDKLCFHESWQDVSFLNMSLRESLQTGFSSQADRLFVAVTEGTESGRMWSKEPIYALQGLTLQYEVPWPINIILNSRCMQIYNQVFTFLLQIKRAKYNLDRLSFMDLEHDNLMSRPQPSGEGFLSAMMSSPLTPREDESSISLTHRVHLLKMRLMHFVNSLHNYMMTRILHSTGLEFHREMEDAHDLDLVIATHARYMRKVHERCLLHQKVQFIKDIVTQVLNLALTFADHWNESIHSFSVKFLLEMEMTLSRCIQFLASFLNNTIKRGSFPHLESLAFALVTSNEQIRC
ncbi:Gamma-tubulin complex component 5 [Lamellibrachia satsuma]|nr:Gamma-tubulin complex component 5 [Lamellibrachia satsuma]